MAEPGPPSPEPDRPEPTGSVTVRYFAAAEEAAGTAEHVLPRPTNATLQSVLAAAVRSRPGLAAVLGACSYLVDAVSARPSTPVAQGSVVDVLPPFAGG